MKGVSPIKSGIYLLAMIIAHVCAAILSGPIGKIVDPRIILLLILQQSTQWATPYL